MNLANDPSRLPSAGRLGSNSIFVNGLPFDNTAAKFWTTLFDELLVEHSTVNEVVLEGATGGLLIGDFLTPEAALQRDMHQLSNGGGAVQQTLEEVIAAMDIIGPPAMVHLTAKAGETVLFSRQMEAEALDADILPFLIVWLLEWGMLAEWAWNQDQVRGDFMAEDSARQLVYLVKFNLVNRHLSEGLFQRTVSVRFQRDPRVEA
jgi:hypothetical protein